MSLLTGAPVVPSPVRRVSTPVRLVVLVALTTAAAWASTPAVPAVVAATGLVALVAARPAWRRLAPVAAGWALAAGAVAAVHLVQHHPDRALLAVARLAALLLPATAVTVSTTTEELVDVVVAAGRPLRRFGLRPGTVALTLALTVRFVPELDATLRRRREAQLARGLRPRTLPLVVPTVVDALNRSQTLAEAIVARSFFDRGDDVTPLEEPCPS